MAIRCIIVTPERTELDRETDYVSLPMFDGELGVMTGRSPMIGRLGYGVLRLGSASGAERFYVDGGFAQVENNEVNILTGRCIPVADLDETEVQKELDEALAMPGSTPEQNGVKQTAVAKARGRVRAAR